MKAKSLLRLAAAGISVLLAASCSSGAGSEGSQPSDGSASEASQTSQQTQTSQGDGDSAEATTVRLSALDQGTSGLALKVIETMKLDQKYGFKAKYSYVGSDASTQNFLQGQTDINFNSAPNDVALAAEKGYDAVTISSEAHFHAAIVAKADSSYTDMASLKGKKIGWYGSDSTGAVVMGLFLKEFDDIDLFHDYEFVQTSPSALVQLLASGQVDAIMDFQPWNSWAQVQVPGGVKVIYDPSTAWKDETGGDLWMTSVAAMRPWVKENPEAAKNVVSAWCDASEYLNKNIDDVIANDTYKKFLEPLTDEGLEAFASWVKEKQPFSCDWTEDQVKNANEYLDKLAADGSIFKKNDHDVVATVQQITSSS